MPLSGLRAILTRSRHQGGELSGLLAAAALQAPPAPAALWSGPRLALVEQLWDEGYTSPGGAAELLRLAAPLGLSAASSLLLLGAEAGGPAFSLANEQGAWVAAHEAVAELRERAALRIQHAGTALARRATVSAWDPAAPSFRRRYFHHAIAREALRDGVAEPILAAIAASLKPHGQLVLVETTAAQRLDAADPTIAAWCRLEGREPLLPAEDTITRMLGRLGFEVRVVEDLSPRQTRLALLGWKRLVRELATSRPEPGQAGLVVAEAELWLHRIQLMQQGRIRLLRWHAILNAAGA
jgi:cyclopropane fatty-acyl-phospholipid synthase-like methyltransferase